MLRGSPAGISLAETRRPHGFSENWAAAPLGRRSRMEVGGLPSGCAVREAPLREKPAARGWGAYSRLENFVAPGREAIAAPLVGGGRTRPASSPDGNNLLRNDT